MKFTRTQLDPIEGGILATIVSREDLRPMRRITNGRRHRPVGSYYSLKNGGGVPWESRVELRGYYHAEVDPLVVRYRAQPHTLEMLQEGRLRKYTPDREDQLEDGQIEILEIKDTYKPDVDDDYHMKLKMAERVYQSLGWRFRIVELAEIEAEPRFGAVEAVQAYRRTAVTTQDIVALADLRGKSPDLTLGDLCEALAPPTLGLHKACAMAVRRIVAIELDRGLISEAVVRLLQDWADDDA
jgi:hypothetical protein